MQLKHNLYPRATVGMYSLLLFFLFIAIATCNTGCATLQERKEKRQEEKVKVWNALHPEKEAKNCAEKYPCKGDSIITVSFDSSEYLLTIEDLIQRFLIVDNLNDSLLQELDYRDSACKKYAPVISRLRSEVAQLQYQVQHQKPVIQKETITNTIVDSAALKGALLENARILKENAQLIKERDEWKEKALTSSGNAKARLWMAIASGVLNLFLMVLLFKRRQTR